MYAFAKSKHGICVVYFVNESSVCVKYKNGPHIHTNQQDKTRVERANVVALQKVRYYLLTKHSELQRGLLICACSCTNRPLILALIS